MIKSKIILLFSPLSNKQMDQQSLYNLKLGFPKLSITFYYSFDKIMKGFLVKQYCLTWMLAQRIMIKSISLKRISSKLWDQWVRVDLWLILVFWACYWIASSNREKIMGVKNLRIFIWKMKFKQGLIIFLIWYYQETLKNAMLILDI